MSAEHLEGAATRSGTQRGAESFGAGARTLGRTGLSVTPMGFGGYRVTDDSPVHRRALADALRGGVNLIDTSTNYGGGGSERLVGRIVANLVQQGEVRREQLVIVSKVGYAQGENLERIKARPDPYPEMVQYSDALWHCIHPDFIRDQLAESLDRTTLSRLDVVLLHNPEYFLLDAAKRGVPLDEARATLDERCKAAFVVLEAAVAAGQIGWYGVSSNGFVEPADSPSFTSVSRMVELAREVAGDDHHFGVLQLPMNLLELGAAHEPSGPQGETPLQIAERADLGVLVNRPLNAMMGAAGARTQLRLAARPQASEAHASVDATLAEVRKLEAQWATGLGKRLVTEAGEEAGDLFRWGRELSARAESISSTQQWAKLRYEVIAPHLGETSAALLSALTGEARSAFAEWWEAYGTAMHGVFEALEGRLRVSHRAQTDEITQRLDPLLPAPWRTMPLPAKAVLSLLGAPIGSVLVGMRQPGYVAEMLVLRDTPVRVLSAAAGVVDLRAVSAALAGLE